ncbi:cysteine desulfurase [Streptosporangium sp. NBC_01639]|uniref:cysteine desulfurase family protein n=1 Tax=unclassified Streptosporangium TaxID=2632669 RepID=UPI002DD92B2C|nr:cysteine desulfurase family protein [Streptosporangium sp. NBC_01756]WSC84893.1 cysteine desulfurase [Streptosporangium sp. NBC_01756]WTD56460.1 cysteine desulfurase [Streptosporangium sp. NBC_01639]
MAYFDAASTEPLHPQAREALIAALDVGWADPARLYGPARRARMLLEQARTEVAEVLGVRPDEVSFTTSGTQAVHLGVLGALHGRRRAGRRLVTSAVEHSSVLHAAGVHERSGGLVETVGVGRTGAVDLAAFEEAVLTDGTALACLQSANHEVGTVQPVTEVAALCARAGVPLLVDAAQTVGRMPLPGGWSVLTASAHKWGGPAGVGVLVVRKGTRWRSPLPEDDREYRRVPGFENVPAIVAAATALRAMTAGWARESARLSALVDRIRTEVPRLVPDVEVIGDPVARAPHIVTFSCLYVEGEALLTELDKAGFAISSGSSCTASTLRPSHVLEAMGVLTHGNIRVSLPQGASAADVDRFLTVLPDIVKKIREDAGVKL